MTTGFQLPAVTTASEFALVPEGMYLFELKAIEDAGMGQAWDDKPPKRRAKWIFEIQEIIAVDDEDEAEDFLGKEFWAWTSVSMNVRATMYEWSCALLGRELDEGEEPDGSELVGKQVRATIVHYKGGKDGTGPLRHKIDNLMKYKPKTSKPKTSKPKKSNLPPASDPEGFEDDDEGDEF